jgi:hypothetical protein
VEEFLTAGLLLSAGLGFLSGLVMLSLGVWTIRDKAFLDELLKNRLYMGAAYRCIISSLMSYGAVESCRSVGSGKDAARWCTWWLPDSPRESRRRRRGGEGGEGGEKGEKPK